MNTTASNRLPELEGLRGVLAVWVFGFHIVGICGLTSALPAWLAHHLDGGHAVSVFIVLSGFVITSLLRSRREGYAAFITRRFFRLYPAYLVCLVVAAALGLAGVMPLRAGDSTGEFAAHVLAHLTLLHGAVPSVVLPNASGSILNPAWSISTEWQFYLLVPVLFWLLRIRPRLGWAGFLALAAAGPHLAAKGGFDWPFLFTNLPLFAVGILSQFVYEWAVRHSEVVRPIAPYLTTTTVLAVAMCVTPHWRPGLMVWAGAFGVLVAVGVGGATAFDHLTSRLLRSRFCQSLGLISYSLYLSHEPIVWLVKWGIEQAWADVGRYTLLVGVTAASVPLALLVSAVLHWTVEQPAIRFAKGLVRPKG
jgi:peptidoglycan/LPS O-acetylase OafA/YrhL